jgi:hypothetical protein
MDFWRTVLVLFRRWYITVPAFAMTLGLAGAAYSAVPVQYQSVSVLVLTTPLSGGTESTQPDRPNPVTNPLMNFAQGLALTASIVIQQLNTGESARTVGVAPGDTTSYLVTNGSTNPELLQTGPFIFVQGTGASPEAAQDIAERVSALAAVVLAQRQTEVDAPPSTHINVQVVVPPVAGVPLKGSRMRAAAAAGALAGLASLVAVYGFESLMTHRRRRRAEKAEQAAKAAKAAKAAEGGRSTMTRDGFGVVAAGVSRRSTDLDPTQRNHVAPDGASRAPHRVNGTAPAPTAGAVDVLEGPDEVDGNGAGRATRDQTEE